MGPLAWIAIADAAALGAGGLAALRTRLLAAAMPVQAAGIGAIGVAGGWSLFGQRAAGGGFRSAIEPALGIDPLTGFFLAALAVVAVPTLVYASGYLPGTTAARGRARWRCVTSMRGRATAASTSSTQPAGPSTTSSASA